MIKVPEEIFFKLCFLLDTLSEEALTDEERKACEECRVYLHEKIDAMKARAAYTCNLKERNERK